MYTKKIEKGANALGLTLESAAIQQLSDYVVLLDKWNKAYNLTAVRDPEQMVSRHILDSLSILATVQNMNPSSLIDVGTGPGLPGIPLAICIKDLPITLLDSNSKKTRFLNQCKMALKLSNIEVVHSRAEQFRPDPGFDLIVSRAFTALENMVQWCHHLLSPNGHFLAMKGQYPEEEIRAIEDRYAIEQVIEVQVPDSEGDRHLVVFR